MENSRRDFLKNVFTATAFAAASGKMLGQIVPRIVGGKDENEFLAEYTVDLSKFPDLATEYTAVKFSGTGLSSSKIIVMRLPDNQFSVLEDRCPHENGAMATTFNKTSKRFTCSLHGAKFDETGIVKLGPATSNLKSFPYEYNQAANTLILNKVVSVDELVPNSFLVNNYPNPAVNQTMFTYTLQKSERISLKIYDSRGATVATLVDSIQAEGEHTLQFDCTSIPSGTYFYKLTTSDGISTTRTLNVIR